MKMGTVIYVLALLLVLPGGETVAAETGGQQAPDPMVAAAAADAPPKLIHAEKPRRPLVAPGQVDVAGTVWLSACVSRHGNVLHVVPARSSGNAALDQAALEAAYKNTYEPAVRGGVPVMAWVTFSVEFAPTETPEATSGGRPQDDSPSATQVPHPDESVSVDRRPELLRLRRPQYPRSALHNGETETVRIKALVDEKGKAQRAIVTESCGELYFDKAAMTSAYKSSFKPAIRAGRPTKCWLEYAVDFGLDDAEVPLPPPTDAIDDSAVETTSGDSVLHPEELASSDVAPEQLNDEESAFPSGSMEVEPGSRGAAVPSSATTETSDSTIETASGESPPVTDKLVPSGVVSQPVLRDSSAYPQEAVERGPTVSMAEVSLSAMTGTSDSASEATSDDSLPDPDEFVEVDVSPEMIHKEAPEYPRSAKEAGVTGIVWVKVLVNEGGEVIDARVGKSSGTQVLDDAAIEAGRKCKFTPAMHNGRPVKVWLSYPCEFTLSESAMQDNQPTETRVDSPAEVKRTDTLMREADTSAQGAPADTGKTPTGLDQDEDLPAPDEFVAVDEYPEVIHRENPEYPRPARDAGITGTVWVKVLVSEAGEVLKAAVDRSSGMDVLDDSAVEAALKWRFKPATHEGRPVKVWVSFPIEFTLDDSK